MEQATGYEAAKAAAREWAHQAILKLRKDIWFLRDTPMQKKLRRFKRRG